MRALREYTAMTRVELRLFRRDPFSVVFVLAFPIMMMTLLASVFGNDSAAVTERQNGMLVWRGLDPAEYYAVASVAVMVAALGLMTLPITLAGYRERGVLRRFRASSVPTWSLPAAQLSLFLVTSGAGAVIVGVIARVAYGASLPQDPLGVVVALLLGNLAFAAVGLLLAAVVRTARSALGAGLLAFFALWLLSGTAPPRAVLPLGLRAAGGALPLAHLLTALQDPWFGFGWRATDLLVLAAYAVAAGVPGLWLLRRS
ncbi:ABC transporter permease [Jatrophihabitans fulvus]